MHAYTTIEHPKPQINIPTNTSYSARNALVIQINKLTSSTERFLLCLLVYSFFLRSGVTIVGTVAAAAIRCAC